MLGHEKSRDMIDHINREFELGGHKAAAIAMVLEKCRILFVSSLDADFVRKIHLEPFATLDERWKKPPRDGEGCKGARHALWRLDAAGAGESCMTGFS